MKKSWQNSEGLVGHSSVFLWSQLDLAALLRFHKVPVWYLAQAFFLPRVLLVRTGAKIMDLHDFL